MNGYVCFYKGKRIEVHAETSYAAQTKAAEEFQKQARRGTKVKAYEISVALAEKDGQPVTHTPLM